MPGNADRTPPPVEPSDAPPIVEPTVAPPPGSSTTPPDFPVPTVTPDMSPKEVRLAVAEAKAADVGRLFPSRMGDRYNAYDTNGRLLEAGTMIPTDTDESFVRDLLDQGVAMLMPVDTPPTGE
jgi:hypothetical protein